MSFFEVIRQNCMHQWIRHTTYELGACSAVDMNRCGAGIDHIFSTVDGDCHEFRTVCDPVNVQIARLGIFHTRHGRKRHKICAIQSLIQFLINIFERSLRENRPITQGSWPKLSRTLKYRYHLSLTQQPCYSLGWIGHPLKFNIGLK